MSTTRLARNLWEIALPSGRLPIGRTLMRRDTYNDDPNKILLPDHKVIVVDLAKFIQMVELGPASFVRPPVPEWDAEKLAGFIRFMTPHAPDDPSGPGAVLMPVVGHHFRFEREPRPAWKIWEPVRERKVYHATYTNGRHRTRFVEYGGATTMPLEVDSASVNFYMETCGLRIEP